MTSLLQGVSINQWWRIVVAVSGADVVLWLNWHDILPIMTSVVRCAVRMTDFPQAEQHVSLWSKGRRKEFRTVDQRLETGICSMWTGRLLVHDIDTVDEDQ